LGWLRPCAKNAGIATWPPTARKPGEYPATANILGAAVIGTDRSTGVIDRYNRAFGYENLLVCDGAMPANPGVNLSLTITQ
jgi:cholesterol oxidase